jgi:hypothetical protein
MALAPPGCIGFASVAMTRISRIALSRIRASYRSPARWQPCTMPTFHTLGRRHVGGG